MWYINIIEIHGGDDEIQEMTAQDLNWDHWDDLTADAGDELLSQAVYFAPTAKKFHVDYMYEVDGTGKVLMKMGNKWMIKELQLYKGPAGKYITADDFITTWFKKEIK